MDNYIKKILYLGPNGSNSQVACKLMAEKLGLNAELTSVSTITKAIEILDSEDDTTAAILPIENSIEGVVRETIDNLAKTKTDIFIQAEMAIPICHCLISKGTKEEIKTFGTKTHFIPRFFNPLIHWFISSFPIPNPLKASST